MYFGELHGADERGARASAEHWMEQLGVSERAADPVEQLSLGNQQRVQLGAALVHGPDLLVLDEPFSGLDPVGVDALSGILIGEARRRGVPVIFSSHQLELVERLCDAVAIVDEGRLVAAGEVTALREQRAGNRWRVELEDNPAGWVAGLPGVEPVGDSLYELGPEADPQALLDVARAAGRVSRFGRETPTLAELFRATVGTA